jgi:hypothetical protein
METGVPVPTVSCSCIFVDSFMLCGISGYVDPLKAGGTFPPVYLTGFNHLAVVCRPHDLAAGAVTLVIDGGIGWFSYRNHPSKRDWLYVYG